MVGLSPAELESLNELIHIDHVYFKPQPSAKEAVVQTSEDIVHKVNSNESAVSQLSYDVEQLASGGSKRDSRGIVVSSEPAVPAVVDPSPCVADHANLDVYTIADDLVSSLSDAEIDSPLDIFQSLGLSDLLDGNGVVNLCSTSESDLSTVSSSTDHSHVSVLNSNPPKHIPSSSQNLNRPEMDSQKLFDEIYDSYLSIKNSSSPDSSVLSDSGCGSDIEDFSPHGDILSPQSSPQYGEGSLLDDYPWQDSFTDLFPDLQ